MVDPLSLSAVTAFLGAAGAGMANEAGKRAWESVGGLVARVAGREVPAPVGQSGREGIAGLLVAEARRNADQARELAARMNSGGVGGVVADGVPHLLPASVRFFTDRKEPLALLDREAGRKPNGLPKVAVLHGPGGIGTSALAVHWGGREARRFPDGTLYADLRSGSPSTAPTAATVLRHFLGRLGVPQEHVPPAVEDRIDLFRTLLESRRLLVVLDHAQSAAQVRPLITAASGVFTVIVARRPLSGLDAVEIGVGPLSDKDARRLLTDIAGRSTMTAARAELPSVLRRCAGSPLALRASVPYLTDRQINSGSAAAGTAGPQWVVAELAYPRLGPDAARIYRLGSLRPWPAFGAALAAAAADVSEREASRLLAELADLHLLESLPDGRYRYRPVVRAHAQAAAAREDGLAGCTAAVIRTVDFLVRFAVQADYAALPQRWHLGRLYKELGAGVYADAGAALTALAGELENLVHAVLTAEEFGRFDLALQGVEAMWALQLKAGCHDELLPALRAGARVAERHCPGTRTAGRMHTQLALALIESPQCFDEAESELMAAAEAEARAGHARGQATATETLGLLRLRQWRFQAALDCFEQADRLLDGIGPADEGAGDLPRARALLQRHQGRALRGLGRFDAAREHLEVALAFFRQTAESYNAARTLTDLAETHLDTADRAAALPLVEEATALLSRENATAHLSYLAALRERCLPGQP